MFLIRVKIHKIQIQYDGLTHSYVITYYDYLSIINFFFCLSEFSAMAGITSGICFIALRDMDSSSRSIYPNNTTVLYDYSFMLEWASNALCILEGFVFLCLLKMDYNDINESGKYNSFMWFCSMEGIFVVRKKCQSTTYSIHFHVHSCGKS